MVWKPTSHDIVVFAKKNADLHWRISHDADRMDQPNRRKLRTHEFHLKIFFHLDYRWIETQIRSEFCIPVDINGLHHAKS